jgi:glycosyltransferase involved in cell wall biosynthesis
VLGRYLAPLAEIRKYSETDPFQVVAYSPVDAGPLDLSLIEPLHRLDALVLYTEYGRGQIEEAFAPLRRSTPDLPFPRVLVIPHGVDTKLFHPRDKDQAREQLFPGPNHFRGDFIVLNANRNQPRKRIDLTIQGFALFARDKPPGVRLYLHMGVEDCGWNVITLARRHGIEDRLILTAAEPYLPAVADEVLNTIFNACDIGINTSIGEGWGLVNLEHAATGAAQVVPRHSACAELWEGAAVMMEPAFRLTSERILTEGRIVTPEEVARALEALYADPTLRASLSAAALGVATRPEYQWSHVAEEWDRLFREMLGGIGVGGDGDARPDMDSGQLLR